MAKGPPPLGPLTATVGRGCFEEGLRAAGKGGGGSAAALEQNGHALHLHREQCAAASFGRHHEAHISTSLSPSKV